MCVHTGIKQALLLGSQETDSRSDFRPTGLCRKVTKERRSCTVLQNAEHFLEEDSYSSSHLINVAVVK